MTDIDTLPDYELAAIDLRAIIDTLAKRYDITMQCAALLHREDWTGDKKAQHRQCVISHKTGPVALPSIVLTYSAGSTIPVQWILQQPRSRFSSGLRGLAHDAYEASKNPRWLKLACFEDLVRRVLEAWNPELFDVLSSCLRDSDVLDYASFEEWAAAFGYDPDSRKAEKTYAECQTIARQMRLLFGERFTEARELAARL